MKLSIRQLQLLVQDGEKLDKGIFESFIAHAKGSVLDVDTLPEALAQLANEVAAEYPQSIANDQEIQEDASRRADEQAGLERCRFWVQKGLVDDKHNLDAVKRHLETHSKGRLSAVAVDYAISSLRDTLHWERLVAPAPELVPPAPPTPPPAPVDDLPPVPAYMLTKDNQLRTKADLGRLKDKYVEFYRGKHGSLFRKRVEVILTKGL